jgi:hypothetical protein
MPYNNELTHWGVKGQKWGVRRYQNKDGSLTPAGKKRYDDVNDGQTRKTKIPSNPYTRVLNDNALIAVNRISQMTLSLGLSRAAAAVATKRGKKATAKMLKAVGNLTVAGFGAEMVAELALNNTNRGE